MDSRINAQGRPRRTRRWHVMTSTAVAVTVALGIAGCSANSVSNSDGAGSASTSDSTTPAAAASAPAAIDVPGADSGGQFQSQGAPGLPAGDSAPGLTNPGTQQTIADSAGFTSATTPTYWTEILNRVLSLDKWGTTYWYGATTDNSNFVEGDFSSPGAAFFVTGTTQYPIQDMANYLIDFLALPQNCAQVGAVSAPQDFTTHTAVTSASFGCGPANKAVFVRVTDWGIAGLQVGAVVSYYDEQERQEVAQTLASFAVDQSDDPTGGEGTAQSTLAEAMASGSGYGFGEDACYIAQVTQADPAFGTIRLSDYGEANRGACQSIDAQVAIVHEGASGWEMVDYFLSPDCISARDNLEGFGASEAVIQEIIGDWPC